MARDTRHRGKLWEQERLRRRGGDFSLRSRTQEVTVITIVLGDTLR